MKSILFTITSYEEKDIPFLTRILDSYTGNEFQRYNVTVALACKYKYTNSNCIMIPSNLIGERFAQSCDKYIQNNYQAFDLVANQDGDILITPANLDYYVNQMGIGTEFIPGFLSYEVNKNTVQLISMRKFSWPIVAGRTEINGKKYITPTRLHSACFVCDKDRYAKYLELTDGKLIGSKKYYVQEYPRIDVYLNGGMQKVIPIESIKDVSALVHHLPDKYSKGKPFDPIMYYTPEQIS